MNKLLRKCKNCGAYTLETACPKCNSETTSPHPPRFSPDDRYLRYRVQSRYEEKTPTKETKKESTAAA
ncbi:MAG: RNA-protein complex protein Nop10 [Nitrososphaerota archaeon]|nr:RNA-protein complex protein Nop10 [Nitrososphaerota archaeon]